MKRNLLALALLGFLSSTAYACDDESNSVSAVEAHAGGNVVLQEYKDDDAAKIAKGLGIPDGAMDEVLVITFKDDPSTANIGLAKDGCLVDMGMGLDPSFIDQLLKGLDDGSTESK